MLLSLARIMNIAKGAQKTRWLMITENNEL